jgi:hypothetical protein
MWLTIVIPGRAKLLVHIGVYSCDTVPRHDDRRRLLLNVYPPRGLFTASHVPSEEILHRDSGLMNDNVGEPPRTGSLRDAYSPPVNEWTFVATPAPGASSSAGSAAPSTPASTWTAGSPPSRARVLDLSPYTYDEIDPGTALDAKSALKWLLSAAVLQYATTGIAMPFEVAKILMQCQWIPKDAIEGESSGFIDQSHEEDDSENEDDSVRHNHFCVNYVCTCS